MLEETTAYDFYDQYEYNDDNMGAIGLITPDSTFNVLTGVGDDWRKTNHGILRYQILEDNYGLDLDIDIDNVENDVVATQKYEEKLKRYNLDGINSSIFIQYTTIYPFDFVRILIPAYINTYQCQQIEELNTELNNIKELLEERNKDDDYKFFVGVEITNYNPLNHMLDDNFPSSIRINNEGDEDMSLKEIDEQIKSGKDQSIIVQNPLNVALQYMMLNNRINDSIKGFQERQLVSSSIRI